MTPIPDEPTGTLGTCDFGPYPGHENTQHPRHEYCINWNPTPDEEARLLGGEGRGLVTTEEAGYELWLRAFREWQGDAKYDAAMKIAQKAPAIIATLTTELAEARRELPKCEGCLPFDPPDEMCPIHGKKAFEGRHQLNECYEYQEQLTAQLNEFTEPCCPACGESVSHTMTHGLAGEPALWNDERIAKDSLYPKCDEMTAEKWLRYLSLESYLARVKRERDELQRQSILDKARTERDRYRLQALGFYELPAALTEAVIEGEK